MVIARGEHDSHKYIRHAKYWRSFYNPLPKDFAVTVAVE